MDGRDKFGVVRESDGGRRRLPVPHRLSPRRAGLRSAAAAAAAAPAPPRRAGEPSADGDRALRTRARWKSARRRRSRRRERSRSAIAVTLYAGARRPGTFTDRDGAADAVDGAEAGRAGAGDGHGQRRQGRHRRQRHGQHPGDRPAVQGDRLRGRALRLRPLLAAAGSDARARRGGHDAAGQSASCGIEIEGHTCNIGTAEYNLALGERRANAVRDYLASRGIGADRLRTVSYGEERPKYDNAREETRRLNRRAALVVRVVQ